MYSKLMNKRIGYLLIMTTVIFGLLVFRLFWLQLILGRTLSQEATASQTREVTTPSQRGGIYDRNHNPLVTNTPAYNIYANPNLIKDPGAIANKVGSVLGIEPGELTKELTTKKKFIWIKHQVDANTKEKLQQMNLPGIGFSETSKRSYLQGNLAASLLGFVGNDNQGLEGLEKQYDQELSGKPGKKLFQSDAQGRLLPQTEQPVSGTLQGKQLVLTIDENIQFYVEQELNQIASQYHPKRALILVMNPNEDGILAMGSWPGFDPEHWQDYPQDTWAHNPATSFSYEPGSVFKIFVTAAALESGVVQPNEYFYDPGYLVVQGQRIHDAEIGKSDQVSLEQGLADSLNVVFAQIAQRLGPSRFLDYTQRFGFGVPTGIDLPGEESGLIIPEKDITPLNLAAMSFGQSIAVTPLQVLTAVSAIANGGKLLRPHLVKAIEDENGKIMKEFKPEVVRQAVSPEIARKVTEMLEKTVTIGTGQKALVKGFRVAGKTGTAQVAGPKGYIQDKYISSFIGFAPVDKPQVAVLVLVDEPQGDYYGGTVAAPVFSNLVEKILNYLQIPSEVSSPEIANSGTVTNFPVPNVIGFPVSSANSLIKEKGLGHWSSGTSGIVIKQEPAAGKMVKPGTVMSLITSEQDAQKVIMPDLTGLSIKEAAFVLSEINLGLSIDGSGLAAKQSQTPGVPVAVGTEVKVEFKPPN